MTVRYPYPCVTAFLLMAVSLHSAASVIIGAGRIYYSEDMKSVDVSVRNTGDAAYLIVSRVVSESARMNNTSGKTDAGFAVVPPAFSLPGGAGRAVRIAGGNNTRLPQDRESLHYLSVTAIPEGRGADNTVQIAVRTWIKLIYRPAGLVRKEAPAPGWRRTEDKISVMNASAFYVFFSGIEINGRPLKEAVTLAPFSASEIAGCPTRECRIKFSVYNEDGSRSEAVSVQDIAGHEKPPSE